MKRSFFVLTVSLLSLASLSAQEDFWKFNAGGGVKCLFLGDDTKKTQTGTPSNVDVSVSQSIMGLGAFLDITKYFELNLGFAFPLGNVDTSTTSDGSIKTSSVVNAAYWYEFAGKLKYPFDLFTGFSMAPAVGLDYLGYWGGQYNGSTPSTAIVDSLNTFLLTLGGEIDYRFSEKAFLRVPVDFGIQLNSRLPDSDYSPYTYQSSYGLAFQIGVDIGYSL
jgi:hypothetical protein